MLHRIRLDLAFDSDDPLNDIKEEVLRHFDEAHTINPGTPYDERGFIIIEECQHDEDPIQPCEVVYEKYTP